MKKRERKKCKVQNAKGKIAVAFRRAKSGILSDTLT
jgi:hypothetical protein